MKKLIEHPSSKIVLFLIVSLFFLTVNAQAAKAADVGAFYKSFLIEKSYVHPGLQPKSKAPKAAVAKSTSPSIESTPEKTKKLPFYNSFLIQKSYAHPAITGNKSSPSASLSTKSSHKTVGETSTSSTPTKPKFDICKFVCLSTCKDCRSNSSNYLRSRQ